MTPRHFERAASEIFEIKFKITLITRMNSIYVCHCLIKNKKKLDFFRRRGVLKAEFYWVYADVRVRVTLRCVATPWHVLVSQRTIICYVNHTKVLTVISFFLYNNCREHPPLRVRRSSLRVPSRTVRVIYIYIFF